MDTVVVGVDGSERTSDALALARRLADPAACLVLAHVSPVLRPLEGSFGVETLAIADRHPARALQRLAAARGASLLVVGSSRHADLRRVMPGSVGQRVLHGAPCPVAIAPRGYAQHGEEPIAAIGCGFDDGPEARHALAYATALAQRLDASVRLLRAVEPPGAVDAVLAVDERGAAAARRVREQPVDALHGLADELGADASVLQGSPAHELTRVSHDLDLLVLGSRGYGLLRGVLLGSVAARVVCGAACPLVVVSRAGTEN